MDINNQLHRDIIQILEKCGFSDTAKTLMIVNRQIKYCYVSEEKLLKVIKEYADFKQRLHLINNSCACFFDIEKPTEVFDASYKLLYKSEKCETVGDYVNKLKSKTFNY